MVRMTAIVWMLSVCMPETLLAGVVFEAGEIDSSTVKPGAYVEIIYGRGERDPVSGKWERLDTAKGYIQAVDAERLIIGEQFWKKEIALERVQKLTILEVAREIKKSVLETAQTAIQRFDQKAVAIMARGEIDTSKIATGWYAQVVYTSGGDRGTAIGKIVGKDSDRIVIQSRESFWKNWKIAYSDIDTLAVAKHQRDIQGRKDSRIKSRRGVGLNIEIGWNGGVYPYDVFWISNPGGGAYAAGFDTQTRQPWSVSCYFGRFLTGDRRGRLGIKYIRQVVEADARGPFPKHSRLWMSSLLLNYQFVILRSTAGIVVAEIAMGKSLTNDDFRYCDGVCFPASSTHISSGLAFILPIHRSIGVQASMRANLYKPKPNESITPFKSGISLGIGPLLEF